MDTIYLRWGVEQRLAFIESWLFWEGGVNRGDLVGTFNVSVPQASKDLALYQAHAPDNMRYDSTRKRYVATEAFSPRFIGPDADAYLNSQIDDDLVLFKGIRSGTLAVLLPVPSRRIDPGVLRLLVAATRENQSVEIRYQSSDLARPGPHWRRISPHAFAHDGMRWHVRAFCHLDNRFLDFVLSRCSEAREPGAAAKGQADDHAWNTLFPVVLIVNPRMPAALRPTVAEDYGMTPDEEVVISVRQALLFYFSKRMRLDLLDASADPREAPVVVKNRDEFDAALTSAAGRP